jgi:transposase-like protein
VRQEESLSSEVSKGCFVKKQCLNLYLKGIGFREIERQTGISHNSVIRWVQQAQA